MPPPSPSIEEPPETVVTVAEKASPESSQPRPPDPPEPISKVCPEPVSEENTTVDTNNAEIEENAIDGDTGRYVLPHRSTQGIPPKRYPP